MMISDAIVWWASTNEHTMELCDICFAFRDRTESFVYTDSNCAVSISHRKQINLVKTLLPEISQ